MSAECLVDRLDILWLASRVSWKIQMDPAGFNKGMLLSPPPYNMNCFCLQDLQNV